MSYEILCTRGPMKGRKWAITQKGLKIGRDESCEIQVKDLSAELFHCIVKLADGKPVVLNLASSKGVEVNGAYVGEATLKPADIISIGNEKFEVTSIDGGKVGSRSKVPIVPIVVMLIAIVAIGVTFFMRTKSAKRPAAEAKPVIAENAAKEKPADDAVSTNRVVRLVSEEIVVTNRIVKVVDNVVVTNYVIEVKRVGEKPAVAETNGENVYVPPEPTEGLKFSQDGKTLVFVPQGIAHVVIPNGVTTIGDRAFANHKALESVTIPPSVTKFGRDAFRGCNRLTGVFITDLAAWCQISFGCDENPWGWNASNPLLLAHNLYLNGSRVRNLEIPKGVTSVGNNAFRGCSSLTSVKIPDSVRAIGIGAFAASTRTLGGNVARIDVDGGNRYYKSVDGLLLTKDGRTLVAVPVGLESVSIPDGVVSIGDRAFLVCNKLSKLTIPDGVTSIGYAAFRGCRALSRIEIPSSMEKIDAFAFQVCENLREVHVTDLAAWCRMSVNEFDSPLAHEGALYLNGELVTDMKIPDGVTSICNYVFRGCVSLESVTIPRTVEHIGTGAFAKCNNLVGFRVGNGNRHYKEDDGLLLSKDGKVLVAVPGGLENLKIPNGVEVIGGMAADCCNRLSIVKIPRGVIRLNYKAFDSCKRLVSVEIPNSVKDIGPYAAFGSCKSLSSVTIPGSVKNVSSSAFCNSGLTHVVIEEGVKAIGSHAFCNTRIMTVTIPDSVTNIAERAFADCGQLESVTVPERLTSIHERAFAGCPKLLDANGKPRLTRVPSTANKAMTGHQAK